MKIDKVIKSFLLKIRFFYLGFKNIDKLNIGDEVIFNNKKYYLSSLKYIDLVDGEYWSMIREETNEYEIHSLKEIKKIKNLKNIKNAILITYRFYMTNWYLIAKRNISLKDVFKVDLEFLLK